MSVAVGGVDRALVDEAQPVAADGAGAFDGVVGVGEHVGTGAATRALDMIGAGVSHADNAATAQRRAVGVDLQVGGVVAAVERNRAGIVDRSLQLKAGIVVDLHGSGVGHGVVAGAVKHARRLGAGGGDDAAAGRFQRAAGDERVLQVDVAAIGGDCAPDIVDGGILDQESSRAGRFQRAGIVDRARLAAVG